MDVAAWLQSLGLERYVSAFRDNDVDAEVLRRLTAEDLRELGIASIGHRRRLLDAIAALTEVALRPTMAPAAKVAAASPDTPLHADAERRQLTVMFCDLVGSTALSTHLDPEDLRELIGAYHRVVTEVVAGFDGFVAKYMATAFSSISVIREPMRTTPSAPSGLDWARSTLSVPSMSHPPNSKRASGSLLGWWSSAI